MLWTPRWLLRHAVAAGLIAAFLALGWWQVRRAAEGNVLSYAYALEWPLFAAFVGFVWYREVRRARSEAAAAREPVPREPAGPPPVRSSRPARVGPAYDDSDDERLAAYNRYLAWLGANPNAAPRDYPG
jgi:hypothetical protein